MISGSYSVKRGDYINGGQVSSKIKEVLSKLGIASEIIRRVMIAVYEAEMNLIIHSYGGEIQFFLEDNRIDIIVKDTGPGIPRIELAIKEGYSTAPEEAREMGFGAGMGLPNIQKNSDLFVIHSSSNGTVLNISIYLKMTIEHEYIHSFVGVESEKCKKCMQCIKVCPTRAIRVWEDKVHIISNRCINCNQCIHVCPTGVFKLEIDNRGIKEGNKKVFIVPLPMFASLGKYKITSDYLRLLREEKGINLYPLMLWEEVLKNKVHEYVLSEQNNVALPVILPLCPAVVYWIQTEYPSLVKHIAPYLTPIQSAIDNFTNDIEITVVPSCPSQICALKVEENLNKKVNILDPFEALNYFRKLEVGALPNEESYELSNYNVSKSDSVVITGLESVRMFLMSLEKKQLPFMPKIVELYTCRGGCYGAPFWGKEPETTRLYFENKWQEIKQSSESIGELKVQFRVTGLKPRRGIRLDENIQKAMRKLTDIEQKNRILPGRDCGICGAPTCLDFAEDIVLNNIDVKHCPYIIKE